MNDLPLKVVSRPLNDIVSEMFEEQKILERKGDGKIMENLGLEDYEPQESLNPAGQVTHFLKSAFESEIMGIPCFKFIYGNPAPSSDSVSVPVKRYKTKDNKIVTMDNASFRKRSTFLYLRKLLLAARGSGKISFRAEVISGDIGDGETPEAITISVTER